MTKILSSRGFVSSGDLVKVLLPIKYIETEMLISNSRDNISNRVEQIDSLIKLIIE